MADQNLAPHAGAVNPSTTAHEDQYAPEPVSGDPVLEACPFCGGAASIGNVRYSKPLEDVFWDEDDEPVTEAFYGHCMSCSASHRDLFAGGYRTEAQAIAKWNRRVTLAHLHLRDTKADSDGGGA